MSRSIEEIKKELAEAEREWKRCNEALFKAEDRVYDLQSELANKKRTHWWRGNTIPPFNPP